MQQICSRYEQITGFSDFIEWLSSVNFTIKSGSRRAEKVVRCWWRWRLPGLGTGSGKLEMSEQSGAGKLWVVSNSILIINSPSSHRSVCNPKWTFRWTQTWLPRQGYLIIAHWWFIWLYVRLYVQVYIGCRQYRLTVCAWNIFGIFCRYIIIQIPYFPSLLDAPF